MRDGCLLQLSTAAALYNDPADPFVARFTGASNTIPGRLRDQADGIGAIEATTGQLLHARLQQPATPGDAIDVLIRPENVVLGVASGGVEGRVIEAHYQGVQTVYALDVLGTRIEAVEVGTSPRYAEGQAVPVRLPPEQCMAYPNRT